ncbi:hypothetical protein RRG08_021254 [Elysia crispata]|uniref:Uncharacterized protein n=1 Tax=Elysia crispata TaxID=231223 RepID=A0AAE1D4L4_9GAST|nr:hypothetical protein RRG08_021254 [Elysia crispata]
MAMKQEKHKMTGMYPALNLTLVEYRGLDVDRTWRQRVEARLLNLSERKFFKISMQHLFHFSSNPQQLPSCSMVSFTTELSRSWCCGGNQWCMQHG